MASVRFFSQVPPIRLRPPQGLTGTEKFEVPHQKFREKTLNWLSRHAYFPCRSWFQLEFVRCPDTTDQHRSWLVFQHLFYHAQASIALDPTLLAQMILDSAQQIADVAISKRPLLFTVWTQLPLRSHQNCCEIFTRKQFLPTSAGNTQAQLHFCG